MSVLAKSLKTVPKELGCTQFVISEILRVGFRTFVRYEAGKRDASVSVLVKIAFLDNISLEHLLTTAIEPNDIVPLEKLNIGEPVQINRSILKLVRRLSDRAGKESKGKRKMMPK